VFSLNTRGPILPHGSATAWDSTYIDPGAMIYYNGTFHMFYNGITGYPAPVSVGYATSTDGRDWTKYNNPQTSDPLYAESDPILLPGASGAWDSQRMVDTNVVRKENGWVMVYLSAAPPGTAANPYSAFGYATSSDGVTWRKSTANPVLSTLNVSDWLGIYLANLLYQDGTLYLYFDVGQTESGRGVTNIWMATHQGLLNN
jgi:hypothetical protein